jgi:hypothetical protein
LSNSFRAARPFCPRDPGYLRTVRDAPHWVSGRTWLSAVDYDTGQRVLFGQEGAPRASLGRLDGAASPAA